MVISVNGPVIGSVKGRHLKNGLIWLPLRSSLCYIEFLTGISILIEIVLRIMSSSKVIGCDDTL